MYKKYGLIGLPLSHTFSPGYFKNKFEQEKILDCSYQSWELPTIEEFNALLEDSNIHGINVTIPYKEQVIPFLDELSEDAKEIGAVNTIKVLDGKRIGYNTDVYGFELSLKEFLGEAEISKAIILGTGGAAKAVSYVLNNMEISHKLVSRSSENHLSYNDLMGELKNYQLIINTTPLGMLPNVEKCPDIPYAEISQNHFFYDLIYNPEKTLFLERAELQGAKIKNGHRMLILQAEKSWQIWND